MEARTRRACVVLALLGLLAVVPALVLADGIQTGVIAGEVADLEGAPLHGVAVTVWGPQVERTVFTDQAGRFRLPALEVGRYSVSATLLGLLAKLDDVSVYIDKTTEVRLALGEAPEAAAEPVPAGRTTDWIEVVAEAPLIDRYDTSVGAGVSFAFLDELPVERFYQSVALVMPGVAGGEDGNPNASGALRNSNVFLIDGVDTTDPTTGLFGLNLAYEAIQEAEVRVAAHRTEYGRMAGAVINVVTKSGTNKYRGTARFLATDPSWNSDYDLPQAEVAHLQKEIAAAQSESGTLEPTISLALGGPLAPDRLWFFAAYEDSESSFLHPTLGPVRWDEDLSLQNRALKLTWQATPANTLVLQHTADEASFTAFTPFERGPSENRVDSGSSLFTTSIVDAVPGDIFALQAQHQQGDFNKLQWNSAVNQDLALSVTLATQERRLERDQLNSRGVTADAPHVGVTAFFASDGPAADPRIHRLALHNGITDQGYEERPREQGNFALSWFRAWGGTDHELRAGVDYQGTESERQFNVPGLTGLDPSTGLPVRGQLFVDFDLRDGCIRFGNCEPFRLETGEFRPYALFNFFAQDARLTREDTLAAYASDSIALRRFVFSLGARFETASGEDDSGGKLMEDDVVAPRLSVTYDPKGDGTILLSLTAGRYYEPFLQQYLDSFGRYEVLTGFSEYYWAGLPFGENPCKAKDPADIDSPCWRFITAVPPYVVQTAQPNVELQRSSVDELVLGFERQLTEATAISLHYIDRQWNDLWDNVVSYAGELDEPSFRLVSTVDNLELAEREYQAIQLLFQKLFRRNWQLLGSYTWSEAQGNLFENDALSDFSDFLDRSNVGVVNRYGLAPYDREHRFRLYANNRIPLGVASLSLGHVLRYETGVPIQQEVAHSFGTRFLTPRGSERLDDVLQWDFSLAADFRLGDELELEVKGEVFNVSDEQGVQAAYTLIDTGLFGKPRTILDLQAPRNYRLTLGLRF